MPRAVWTRCPPPPRRSATSTRATTTAPPTDYDAKWGIDFGEIGQAQVLGKLRKALGAASSGRFDRALEIGAGTGYFTLNLLRAGVIGAGDLHRHLARACSPTLRGQRRAAGPRRRRPSPATPSSCRSRTTRFDLVLGHAVLHHLPDLHRAFARVPPRAAPGGTLAFAGEPSRYGDRIARLPQARRAPRWRRRGAR